MQMGTLFLMILSERKRLMLWATLVKIQRGRCLTRSRPTFTESFLSCGYISLERFSSYRQNRHQHLKLTKINTYGLVYEWTGTNSTLKPVLLAAHQGETSRIYNPASDRQQDTVPVNPSTLHEWTHPPWSGHYDGK